VFVISAAPSGQCLVVSAGFVDDEDYAEGGEGGSGEVVGRFAPALADPSAEGRNRAATGRELTRVWLY
jgi:hypothetical protein